MAESGNAEYILYSSPFSLYSMMARHTIILGSTTHGARPPKSITLAFVNHAANENLREDYLQLNPKGQVPTMTGNVLEQPLTESNSISLYLAENHYPAMLPAEHAAVIRDLIKRIHAIPGPSFSIKNPTAEMQQRNPSAVDDILKNTDLSPEYRKALEAKLDFHNKNYGIAFQPAIVAKARADLQTIFAEITERRRQSEGDDEWIFGSQVGPTVLDSHVLPIVLRCLDVGNAELVPPELQRWAEIRAQSPTWQKVMQGRPTRWNPSMGPIAAEMQSL